MTGFWNCGMPYIGNLLSQVGGGKHRKTRDSFTVELIVQCTHNTKFHIRYWKYEIECVNSIDSPRKPWRVFFPYMDKARRGVGVGGADLYRLLAKACAAIVQERVKFSFISL